jgi:hypothetical protein
LFGRSSRFSAMRTTTECYPLPFAERDNNPNFSE